MSETNPNIDALLSELQLVRTELTQGKRDEAIERLRRLVDKGIRGLTAVEANGDIFVLDAGFLGLWAARHPDAATRQGRGAAEMRCAGLAHRFR